MGERTRLVSANATKSLRTTVPKGIARQFNLDAGSELVWQIVSKGGELVIEVRPE